MHIMDSWFGTVWVQLQAKKEKKFLYKAAALSHTCQTKEITHSKHFSVRDGSVPDTSSLLTGGFRRKIGHPLRCAPPWPPWVMHPWRPNGSNAAPRHFGHDADAAGLGASSAAPCGEWSFYWGGKHFFCWGGMMCCCWGRELSFFGFSGWNDVPFRQRNYVLLREEMICCWGGMIFCWGGVN